MVNKTQLMRDVVKAVEVASILATRSELPETAIMLDDIIAGLNEAIQEAGQE